MNEKEKFLSILLDDTNAVASMNYSHDKFQDETGAMMHAILWGSIAKLSFENLGYDSIVTNLLKERSFNCLKQIHDDNRPAITGVKDIIEKVENEGRKAPSILKKFVKRNELFTNGLIDQKVSLQEMEELINFFNRPFSF